MEPTCAESSQIALNEIFSVKRILAARGFWVSQEGTHACTVLNSENPTKQQVRELFEKLKNPHEHSKLRNFSGEKFQENQRRYSATYEWFLGQILVDEFDAFSASFSVKLRNSYRPGTDSEAGDFDVLAVLGDMSLLYMECKTGAIEREKVRRCIERGHILSTIGTVVVYSKLESRHKIVEAVQDLIYPGYSEQSPELIEASTAGIDKSEILAWHRTYFIAADEFVNRRLQTVLRLIAAAKVEQIHVWGVDQDFLKHQGFKVETLKPSKSLAQLAE